eukprot:1524176-Rhodomonas_salina.3
MMHPITAPVTSPPKCTLAPPSAPSVSREVHSSTTIPRLRTPCRPGTSQCARQYRRTATDIGVGAYQSNIKKLGKTLRSYLARHVRTGCGSLDSTGRGKLLGWGCTRMTRVTTSPRTRPTRSFAFVLLHVTHLPPPRELWLSTTGLKAIIT